MVMPNACQTTSYEFPNSLFHRENSNSYNEMAKIAFGMLQLLEFQIRFRDWHLKNSNGRISDQNLRVFELLWRRIPQILAV